MNCAFCPAEITGVGGVIGQFRNAKIACHRCHNNLRKHRKHIQPVVSGADSQNKGK